MLEAYQDLKMPDVFLTVWYRARSTEASQQTDQTFVVEYPGALAPGVSDFRAEVIEIRSKELIRFYRTFQFAAEKRGIPLFLVCCDMQACVILHAFYRERLTPVHWEAYEAIGMDVARANNYKVSHLGEGVWQHDTR